MKDKSALTAYAMWRSLRSKTVDHSVLCDCSDCRKRGKLGVLLDLPYAGEPIEIRLRCLDSRP